jgi:hypothetical protein
VQPPSGGRPFVFVLTRAALGRRTSRRIRAPPRRMPRLLAQLRWLAFGDSWFNAKRSKYPPTSRGAKVRAPRRAALAPEGAPRTPQPGDRTRTHGAAQPAETAACGASRRAPSPSLLTSCTPHSLRRAVWRTHTHTEGGPARGGRGGTRPHGTHFSAAAARVAFPRDPARPQPTTAWRTLRRTLPARDTRADPRRVACTIGPSPLSTAAHARINHAVQGRPRTAAAQHERQNQLQQQRTKTARARRSPLGRPSLCPRTDFAAPGAATPAPKASCAMHCTPLAQDLQRLTTPAPPLPARCTLPQHSTRAYGCD